MRGPNRRVLDGVVSPVVDRAQRHERLDRCGFGYGGSVTLTPHGAHGGGERVHSRCFTSRVFHTSRGGEGREACAHTTLAITIMQEHPSECERRPRLRANVVTGFRVGFFEGGEGGVGVASAESVDGSQSMRRPEVTPFGDGHIELIVDGIEMPGKE
jgi:hypothetical protein